MGYSTTKVNIEEAKKLAVGGEVVSASRETYFEGDGWKDFAGVAELKDDNKTFFFGLADIGFVEYVLSEPLPEEKAKELYVQATNDHYNFNY